MPSGQGSWVPHLVPVSGRRAGAERGQSHIVITAAPHLLPAEGGGVVLKGGPGEGQGAEEPLPQDHIIWAEMPQAPSVRVLAG